MPQQVTESDIDAVVVLTRVLGIGRYEAELKLAGVDATTLEDIAASYVENDLELLHELIASLAPKPHETDAPVPNSGISPSEGS